MIDSNRKQRQTTARASAMRNTFLRERWLTLTHVGWIVGVLLDATIFVPGAVLYYRQLRIPCSGVAPESNCNAGQLSPAAIQALWHLGISLDAYAALVLTIVLAASLVLFAVGGLIAWRKWRDGMGLFVSLVLITLGATGISDTLLNALQLVRPNVSPALGGIVTALVTGIIFVQWPAVAAFLLTFPTGRFIPRWSWLVIGLWIAVELAFILHLPTLVIPLAILVALGSTLAVQVYRYRRVYGHTQRQQTKWLVFSIAVGSSFLAVILVVQALALRFNPPGSLFQGAELLSSVALFLPMALAIGVAILRYRLYDIDILINRALVYGTLTAILAALYFGVVIGAQSVVQAITGQRSQTPVFIVATTLLIAALFNPLRQRLQAFIDRRFYRRKYDAARTIEAFGTSLRTETDLTQLSEQLVAVVQETMQPAHVSLWLRTPSHGEARPTPEGRIGSMTMTSTEGDDG
jgi:hypothetical protein